MTPLLFVWALIGSGIILYAARDLRQAFVLDEAPDILAGIGEISMAEFRKEMERRANSAFYYNLGLRRVGDIVLVLIGILLPFIMA